MKPINASARWKWSLLLGLLFCCSVTSAATGVTEKGMPTFLKALHRIMPGWTFGGDLDMGFSIPLRWKGKERAAGEVRVSFRNGFFSDPEESFLGDGLAGVIRLGGVLASGETTPVNVEIVITKGEFLLGPYYFDVGVNPLRLRMQGAWDPQERSLAEIAGNLEWGDRLGGSWTGSMSGLGDSLEGVLEANIHLPSHEKLFHLFVVQPLAEIQPEWEDATMAGSSRCEAKIDVGKGSLRVKGRLYLQETDFHLPLQGIVIQGLEGEIPFDLPLIVDHSAPLVGVEGYEQGWVEIKRVLYKALSWSDLRVRLRASPNRFESMEPLVLPLFQGRLMARNMQILSITPLPPTIAMSLLIENVDMADLTRNLTPFVMAGKLEGAFPEISIQGGDLSAEGGVQIQVWDGEVFLKDFWGERILSKRRRLGFEVNMTDLNMELVTQSFSFGQMGGVLEGDVKNLVFSFGQPESFDLQIRSVPRRGIKQYVDAKAVANLSILSSGVQAPLLPWFKYYPYSKLGISCKLQNDVFTLRGTIVEGETEYLVKRGFFRGINVINRNPDNRIPWKDMVQRIGRIVKPEGDKIRVETGS